MKNNLRERMEKILRDNLYMTISVASKDGNPWIANLYYAYDKNYTLYWYSPKNSIHSKTIKENPVVALTIFNSTAVGDDVDALYMKAKVYEIESKSELLKGLVLYVAKMIKTKFVNKVTAERIIKQFPDFQGMSKLRM